MKKGFIAALTGVSLLAAGLAFAQTIGVPQVTSIGANDLFQDVVNGTPQVGNQYASSALLGNYGATLGGNNPENLLIGGDATTNLFQRATTGASVTTTITYGGPDRWAYWSGTSTAMTVSRDTTAADLPQAYQAAFKMARTSGQTGVVQMCMIQEVESVNALALAGQTAEVDFHAIPGANFSPAGGAMQVVFISGTGTDQGVSTAAFNYNGGGGGSSTWTGQVNTAVTVNVTGAGRYTAVAPIPSTATEIAIAICYTPVGTAGTNDYVALSGIQLTRNSALTSVAGTTGAALPVNDTRAKSFSRRSQALETVLQQRYFYNISEVTGPSAFAPCWASSTTVAQCLIQFPVPMRAVPVFTGDGGLTAGFAVPTTVAGGTLGACTGLAVSTNIASTVATASQILLACTATTVPAAGSAGMFYNNGGAGRIKASAEL